ncbi:hypothetical protein HK105_207784 [Polyrhizophydium stewartii]|uniref:Cysteine dioxygenase n=1 Tax=Polyrhizophydium stewartii TaxID=2732419 RepID=A0ABR4MZI8_9FUNG
MTALAPMPMPTPTPTPTPAPAPAPAAAAAAREPAPVPTPRDLGELCALLHAELAGGGLDSAHVDVARVQALMAAYKSNAADWERFALFDAGRYTRNLVDAGNGRFNLMVLCWGPGQASPIHDHANSHCLVKVLEGAIDETQYEWPEGVAEDDDETAATRSLTVKQRATYTTDEVTYMHDKIGLHKVANPRSTGAISLHLYTPPIESCKTFCETTGAARASGKSVFYSVGGERCNYVDGIKASMSAKADSTQ